MVGLRTDPVSRKCDQNSILYSNIVAIWNMFLLKQKVRAKLVYIQCRREPRVTTRVTLNCFTRIYPLQQYKLQQIHTNVNLITQTLQTRFHARRSHESIFVAMLIIKIDNQKHFRNWLNTFYKFLAYVLSVLRKLKNFKHYVSKFVKLVQFLQYSLTLSTTHV